MTRVNVGTPNNKNNLPYVAAGTLVILIGYAVLLAVTGHMSDELVGGLIITTIPSVTAAGFAERAARDIRNGVVQDKAKQGTHEALIESGVKSVVTTAQQTQPVVLDALSRLAESNTRLVASLDAHDSRTGEDTTS